MSRRLTKLLFVVSHLLLLSLSHAVAQAPEGSVKITAEWSRLGSGYRGATEC